MILAFDTSTKALSVAIGHRDGRLVDAVVVDTGAYMHAERLLPTIDALLRTNQTDRQTLTAVAFAAGPGSYTGLRIGASTAKAIAHAAGIPILPVDTCEALAAGAVRRGEATSGTRVYAVIDARRMEVFTAAFEVLPDGGLQRLGATQAAVLEGDGAVSAVEAFPGCADGPGCWAGDGAPKLAELLAAPDRMFVEAAPEAQDVLAIGARLWGAGEVGDLAYCEPAYLKEFAAAMPKNPLGLGRLSRDRMPENLRG